MTNHVALSSADHRTLRIRTERSAAMGDALMCCATFPMEFRNVQNQYPILFRMNAARDAFSALALFGFEDGENLFLGDDGWEARYRPLAMEIQPFLIGLPREAGGDKQVHVDMASPRISRDEQGTRVFDDEGRATPMLEAVSELLAALDAGHGAAAGFIESLKMHDLLEPLTLEIELVDGSKHRLVGFHTINEERLRGLDGEALGTLHAAGHLFPAFMVLASLSNLAGLVERKNRLLAGG